MINTFVREKQDVNPQVEEYIDMHMHTELSDGDIKCKKLPSILRSKGIGVFSVTDHDCIDSYYELEQANLEQLEYYSGVELSSIYKGIRMHILAYGFDPHNGELISLLQQIQLLRRMRFKAMLNNMNNNMGIKFDIRLIDQIEEKSKSLGSANFLSLLAKSGYYDPKNDLYQRYIRPSNPHIKYRVDCEESIRIVKKAGGILVLAHPYEIERENPNINIGNIIEKLFALGIDGLEVYNSSHSRENVQRYLNIAQQYNGLISGGSDYHGMLVKPGVDLGCVTKEYDKIKTLTLVDELRKRNSNSISC
jgi:predicted metal-dependent phosphoesterase TrpH